VFRKGGFCFFLLCFSWLGKQGRNVEARKQYGKRERGKISSFYFLFDTLDFAVVSRMCLIIFLFFPQPLFGQSPQKEFKKSFRSVDLSSVV
jgi:hypothetical protein